MRLHVRARWDGESGALGLSVAGVVVVGLREPATEGGGEARLTRVAPGLLSGVDIESRRRTKIVRIILTGHRLGVARRRVWRNERHAVRGGRLRGARLLDEVLVRAAWYAMGEGGVVGGRAFV